MNKSDPLSEFYRERLARAIVRDFGRDVNRLYANWQIADVGCGYGYWLERFASWSGATVFGVDLDEHRLQAAKSRVQEAQLAEADARRLPWADGSFDLVTQFTLFTSVRKRAARQEIAREMQRVLKAGGWILWYDFFAPNWKNRRTRAIGKREIHDLFPECAVRLRRVTLAPPVARMTLPIGAWLTRALEALPFLRTHYLGVIQPVKSGKK